jgi:hypothetical protein
LAWGGPFNGQAQRCLLFSLLIERLRPVAIVETGTYLGTTTEWMAAFQIPVFTCEGSEENFGFAQARLLPMRNVSVTLGDSREFLRTLLNGALRDLRRQTNLFYLDAHWNADLPLAEEIDIICRSFPRAVIVIDDFEVPDDLGYGFDSYGPDHTLNAAYIDPAVKQYQLAIFYPATPSSQETGMRRGCIVLGSDAEIVELLGSVSLLRRAGSTEATADSAPIGPEALPPLDLRPPTPGIGAPTS